MLVYAPPRSMHQEQRAMVAIRDANDTLFMRRDRQCVLGERRCLHVTAHRNHETPNAACSKLISPDKRQVDDTSASKIEPQTLRLRPVRLSPPSSDIAPSEEGMEEPTMSNPLDGKSSAVTEHPPALMSSRPHRRANTTPKRRAQRWRALMRTAGL